MTTAPDATGIWSGQATQGGGHLAVRMNLFQDGTSVRGVLFLGDPAVGALVDSGRVDGYVTDRTLTLRSTTHVGFEASGTLGDDRFTGTLSFADPAVSAPLALARADTSSGYRTVGPVRIFDTRTGGPKLEAGTSRRVPITGKGGLPWDGVSAVLVNLTATEVGGWGYLTAWASGTPQPGTSNLNFERPGATAANLAIVPVGDDGLIEIYSYAAAHVIVDVFGWFPTGSMLRLSGPTRILDTRQGPMPGPGAEVEVPVAGREGVPSTGVAAAVVNVTATEALAPGYVTVWPSQVARPNTSTLNMSAAGQTIANHAIVPVGTDGKIKLFTETGTHLLVDLFGWIPVKPALPAETLPDNLLRDGSFETTGTIIDTSTYVTYQDANIGSWLVSHGSVDHVGFEQGTAFDGTHFIDLNGNAGGTPGLLQQLVPTDRTRRYKVAFHLSGNPNGAPAVKQLEVTFGAVRRTFSFDTTGRTNAALGWRREEFVADPDCNTATMLTFRSLTEGDKGPNIDAVVVTDAGAGSGCLPTGYRAVTPARVLDTREAVQLGYHGAKPGAGAVVSVQIAGAGGLPGSGIGAVVINLTGTQSDGWNYVTAWPSGSPMPATSNLNLEAAGETRANAAVVPVGADGKIELFAYAGVHLIVDVFGYFAGA